MINLNLMSTSIHFEYVITLLRQGIITTQKLVQDKSVQSIKDLPHPRSYDANIYMLWSSMYVLVNNAHHGIKELEKSDVG